MIILRRFRGFSIPLRVGRTILLALKPSLRRDLVTDLMQRFGASQRQPRALLQLSRTVSRYELVARDQSALEMRIKEITQVRVHYGAPRMYVMLRREVAKALDKWAYENGMEIDFSRPRKPTDNAKNESFNGRFREECLNAHWFLSLEDARRKIEGLARVL